jgi:cyclophilin family peptidyl-prolyl cis-trans isomerase
MKKILFGAALVCASFNSFATLVEMHTSQGEIKINLFDQQTPITVANFLSYVDDESYNNTVIHRSISDFIIQGGGFTYSDDFDAIETKSAITNEPVLSNVTRTIAMAKVSDDENSATSQWFFNMADNSANLDLQNGGFTVFGEITADSQETLDNIASLVHCSEVPVINITSDQCDDFSSAVTSVNLVTIYSISILDDDPDSSANLSPVENTLIDEQTTTDSSDSSSSGSLAWLFGALLLVLPRRNWLK